MNIIGAVRKPGIWIFLYAISLHLTWGTTLLLSSDPLGITAIATLVGVGIATPEGAGAFYLTIGFLAMLGLFAPRPAGLFFLLPQQLVLVSSAIGAIGCMISGTFADGVVRSSAFLVADQAPAVIAAALHTLALWTSFFVMER